MTPTYTRFAKCFAIVTMFSCLLLQATTSNAQTTNGQWLELGGTNTSTFNGSINSVTLDGKGNLYTVGGFKDGSGIYYVAHWNFNTSSSYDQFGPAVPNPTSGQPLQTVTIDPTTNNIVTGPGNTGIVEYYPTSGIWDTIGGTKRWTNNVIEEFQVNSTYRFIVSAGDTINKKLYVGGNWAPTNGGYDIRAWDGTTWDGLNRVGGYSDAILALTVDNLGEFFFGGLFRAGGTDGQDAIQGWDKNQNRFLDTFLLNGQVNALATDPSNNLYAGGNFTNPNTAKYPLLKWNRTAWSTITEFTSPISALATDNDGNVFIAVNNTVYEITTTSNVPVQLGSSFNGAINTLFVDKIHNTLYVGGAFTNASGNNYIAYLTYPKINTVSVTTACPNVATPITITGTGFTGATGVTVGTTSITNFTVSEDGTTINATVPPTVYGAIQVTLSNGNTITASQQFTQQTGCLVAPTITNLSATSSCANVATPIVIVGTNFSGATLTVGATTVTPITVSATNDTIRATVPAGAAGTVTVTTAIGLISYPTAFTTLDASIRSNALTLPYNGNNSATLSVNNGTVSDYYQIDFSNQFNFNIGTSNIYVGSTSGLAPDYLKPSTGFPTGLQTFDNVPFNIYPFTDINNNALNNCWYAGGGVDVPYTPPYAAQPGSPGTTPTKLSLNTQGKNITAIDILANTIYGYPNSHINTVQFWYGGRLIPGTTDTLFGGKDIRDYNQNYLNTINNNTTKQIWSDGTPGVYGSHRVDKIRIALPYSQPVDSVLVLDSGAEYRSRIFVMGATAEVVNTACATTISWTSTDPTVNSLTTPSITVSPTTTTPYQATLVDCNGKTCTQTLTITFTPAPTITKLSATTACAGVATPIVIVGTNFSGATLTVGGTTITPITVSATNDTITATVPSGVSGAITVTTTSGSATNPGFTLSNPTTATVTVSAIGSYTWHGTTYTSSTSTATFDSLNAAGCDSLTTLNLTITPLPTVTIPTVPVSTTGCPNLNIVPVLTGSTVPAGSVPGYVTVIAGQDLTSDISNVHNINDPNTGLQSQFNNPVGLAFDPTGNTLYVADEYNNQLRTVSLSPLNGNHLTGTLNNGTSATLQDGPLSSAGFHVPRGISFDKYTNAYYVADEQDYTIRQILDGQVTTIAGSNNSYGTTDGFGTSAQFFDPASIAVTPDYLYIADAGNNLIRRIDKNTHEVTTLVKGSAGGGWRANPGIDAADYFINPTSIILYNNNLYVTDASPSAGHHRIIEIEPKSGAAWELPVTGTEAAFQQPYGIAADPNNNGFLYVSDATTNKILRIDLNNSNNVTTVVGNEYTDAVSGKTQKSLFPAALIVDNNGFIYVASNGNGRIVRIATYGYSISPALPAGLTLNTTNGTISGTPTGPTPSGDYVLTYVYSGGSVQTPLTLDFSSCNPPTITSLSATSACANVATPIVIVGTNFSGATLTVGGTTITPITVSATNDTIWATVPAGAVGTVTVTTASGPISYPTAFTVVNATVNTSAITIPYGSSTTLVVDNNTVASDYEIDFKNQYNFNNSTYKATAAALVADTTAPKLRSSQDTVLGNVHFMISPWTNATNAWSAVNDINGNQTSNPTTLTLNIGGKTITALDLLATTIWGQENSTFDTVYFWHNGVPFYNKVLVGGEDYRNHFLGEYAYTLNNTTTTNVWKTPAYDPQANLHDFESMDKIWIQVPSADGNPSQVDSVTIVDHGAFGVSRIYVLAATAEVVSNVTTASSVRWSTGATTPTITVSPKDTTVYTVTLNGVCTANLTVNVIPPPAPTVAKVSATSSCSGVATPIVITGTNFIGATLTVGATTVTPITVSATNDTIWATVPANATGAIVVTTASGSVNSSIPFTVLNPSSVYASPPTIPYGSSSTLIVDNNKVISYDTINFSNNFNLPFNYQNVTDLYLIGNGPKVFNGVNFYIYPFANVGNPNTANTTNAWTSAAYTGEAYLTLNTQGKNIGALDLIANTGYGIPQSNLDTVQFWSHGQVVYSKILKGNEDIRDYNQAGFTNYINNTTTVNIWNNTAPGFQHRLDQVKIQLPTATQVDSVVIIDAGSVPNSRIFVLAASVEVVSNPAASVTWSNGVTAYTNTVSPLHTTTYSVNLSSGGATCTATVTVNVTPGSIICPTITSFLPTTGYTNEVDTIRGAGFTGATAVKFGSGSATFTIIDDNTITALVPASVGTGIVSVTTPGCSGVSNGVFTLVSIPTVTAVGGNQFCINGPTVSYSAVASAPYSISKDFTWYKSTNAGNNSSNQIVGNSNVYSFLPSSFGVGNYYLPLQLTATYADGTKITVWATNTITAEIDAIPSVSIVASATTVTSGTSITFTATATNGGTAPTYQWYNGSAAISGATSATYTYTPLNGDSIYVQLKLASINACKSVVNSNGIMPTVTCPTITSFLPTTGFTNEVDTIRGVGFTGAIAVKFGRVSAAFTIIDDNTIRAVVPASVGTGIVSVITPACSDGKGVFTLVPMPTVTAGNKVVGGGNQFCINGSTVSYLAVASAPYSISKDFTWYKSTNAGNNSSDQIVGNSNVYSFLPSSFGVGNYYLPLQFTATYADGTKITVWATNTITAEIDGLPSVSIVASATTVTSGTSVTFTATATNGGTAPTYQWYNGSAAITGATTSTYSYVPANGDSIYVKLTAINACQSVVNSNGIKLTVCPTITSFLPTTGFTNEVDTIRGAGFTGATAVKFGSVSAAFTFVNDNTITAVVPASVGTGIVSVTTPGCSGSKGGFTLVPMPTVTAGGGNQFCINGPTVSYSAVASAPYSISKDFTWYKSTNAGNNSSDQIVGNSNVYSFLPSSFGVGNYYLPLQFTATYADGTKITVWATNTITAEIDGLPSVSIVASPSGSVVSGTTVTFTATATNGGAAPTYQWYNGSAAISGATASTYSYVPANGDSIYVKLTAINACQSVVNSNGIKETVTGGCPTITSFLPTTGFKNEVDTIRGVSFTGVTSVTFGGVSAAFTFINDNTIKAVVPASVGTGIVSVTTPTCSGSKGVFTLVPIPTVGAVNKVKGNQYFCINGPEVSDSAVANAPYSISRAFTWYKSTNAGNNSSDQIVGYSQVYSFLPSSFGVGNYYLPLQLTATYPDGTQITVWDAYQITAEIDGIPTLGIGGNSSVALNGSNTLSSNGPASDGNLLHSSVSFQWFSNTTNSTKNATYIGAGGVQSVKGNVYPYINPSYSTSGTNYYFCVVTGTCGATDTSNIIPVTVLPATASAVDIAEITSESTGLQSNLYPNPSHGAATLALKGVTNKVKVTVTGLTGNIVGTYEVSADGKLQLPSDKLASGSYFINVNDGTTKKTLKWVNIK